MRLRKVYVKDFMPIEEFEVELPSGITLVLGENATGKSSLLEAIRAALYGFAGKRRCNRKDCIRDGAKDFLVRLVVDTEQGPLDITLTSKEHVLTLSGGGKETVNVPQKVASITGIDRTVFSEVLFAQQGELAQFVELTPSKRSALIKQVLKLTAVDALRDVASAKLKVYRTEIIPEKEIERLKNELEEISKKVEEHKSRWESAKEQEEKLKEKGRILHEQKYKIVSALELAKAIAKDEKLVAEKPAVLAELEKAQAYIEKHAGVLQDEQRMIEERTKLTEWLRRAKKTITELEDLAKKCPPQKEMKRLQERAEKCKAYANALNAATARLNNRMAILERAMGEMQNRSSCILCGTCLSEETVKLLTKSFVARIKQLSEVVKKAEAKRRAFEKERAACEKRINEAKENVAKGVALCRQMGVKNLGELKKLATQATAKLQKLEEKLRKIEATAEEVRNRQKAVESLKAKLELIEKTENEIEAKKKKLEQFGFGLTEEEITAQLEQVSQELSRLQQELANCSAQVQKIYGEYRAALTEEKNIRTSLTRYEELSQKVSRIVTVNEILTEFQKKYAASMIEKLPANMNIIIKSLGFSYTVELNDKFELLVHSSKFRKPKKAEVALSGAERMSLGLAFRVALAHTLTGSSLLILDEPTYGFSEERVKLLVDLLGRLRDSGMVSQMLVVTHEREFMNCADYWCRIDEKSSVAPTASVAPEEVFV